MKLSELMESKVAGTGGVNKHHVARVSYHRKSDPDRRYEAVFKTTHAGGKEETERRAKEAFLEKGKIIYNIVHEMYEKDSDMLGKKHEKCGGTFKETGIQDDMHGTLHCSKCNKQINRRPVKESKTDTSNVDCEKILKYLTAAHRALTKDIDNGISPDGKRTLGLIFDTWRESLLDDGFETFEKDYERLSAKYPDAFDLLVEEMFERAGLGMHGTYEDFIAKVSTLKVSEGRWVKGPGGVPLGKDGQPTTPKGPRVVIAAYSDAYWDKKEQESTSRDFIDPSTPIARDDGKSNDQIERIVRDHFNFSNVDWTFSGKAGSRKPANTTLATQVIRVSFEVGAEDDLGVPVGTGDTEYIVVGRNYKKPEQIDFVDYGQNPNK